MATLTNLEYQPYTEEEAALVGQWFMKFSNLWDEWQNPDDKDRSSWKFKSRKHIPNINFLLCEIHKILGIEYHNQCFPIPKTKNSVRKLREFYFAMLRELLDRKLITLPEHYKQTLPSNFRYRQLTLDSKFLSPVERPHGFV